VLKPQEVMGAATGLAFALLACAAPAQDAPRDKAVSAPPAPDSMRSAPMQAPVGHRQPRVSDLPPASRLDEDKAAAAPPDDINERLRICRGC
jgi:hypothetical protein